MSDQDNLFDAVGTTNTESEASDYSINQWVGEGKKYRSEADFVKAMYHAQDHIKRLEDENRTHREKLEKAKGVDDLLNAINKPQSQPQGVYVSEEDNLSSKPLDQKALKDSFAKFRDEERQQENIKTVTDTMKKLYGDKAGDMLTKAVQDTGLDVQTLQAMAAKSPSAVLKLLGVDSKAPNTGFIGAGSINTAGLKSQQSDTRDSTYWTTMRKNDPKSYYSPQMTSQRMNDAAMLGDRYFKQ